MSRLSFQIDAEASGSRARAATFRTLHNEVKTPVFMPVGTLATVKAQHQPTLEAAGSQVLLANTYHLMLRPGAEVFRKLGGIQKFMNWGKSVLTDSGGFQVFSLDHACRIDDEGAEFRSFVDLRKIRLTPELSIETQKAIGSDIMMVLDQCIPSTAARPLAEEAMRRTHLWARRSLASRGDSPQSLFGIVQGALFPDLRKQSADFLRELPFDGFAIGGLAVGETKSEREDFTELTAGLLPRELPRYLMGVGTPIDLLEAVHRGVDMFDCILPTALAQQGVVYTSKGRLELRRGVYRLSDEKLDPDCECPTCREHSRAYLHHLVRVRENLGWTLLGTHNIYFYHRLMREMRAAILDDTFQAYYREKRERLLLKDEDNPITHPRRKKPSRGPRGEISSLGNYEIHRSPLGHSSIRHIPSQEIMHSVSNPEVEARRLYVEQSRLAERFAEKTDSELVIWDVGLGAATNAMAAVRAYQESGAKRPVRIVSFENDLDSLNLALRHAHAFPHLQHPAPHLLLRERYWKLGELSWELAECDFLQQLEAHPVPDVVFYDPFSFKTDSPLWTLECFQRLRRHFGNRATELYTYSASTAVRARLLVAGFFVGRGLGTGPKSETTIAFTDRGASPLGEGLLKKDWLEHWERSGARAAELDSELRSHLQFN